MTDSATGNADDQHANAVWLIDVLAQRVRTRPNGIAVLFLPATYVNALRWIASTPLPDPSTDLASTSTPAAYLGVCGAKGCGYEDEWEAEAPGSPCPACGNQMDNVYERLADLLDAGEQAPVHPTPDGDPGVQTFTAGQPVDVTPFGRRAGFGCPVVMTAAAWQLAIEQPDAGQLTGQGKRERVEDIVASAAERVRVGGGDDFLFTVAIVPRGSDRPQSIQLRCVWGPDSGGYTVVTIMAPEES